MPDVHAKVPAPHASHSEGFDKALDAALDRASELGKKGVFEVDVQFFAEINVTNPGQIQQYGVTLSQRPGGGG
jgi:hypothetical protein